MDALTDAAMRYHIFVLEDAAAKFQRLVRRCAALNRRGQVAELTRLLDGAAAIPTLHRLPRYSVDEPSSAVPGRDLNSVP